MKNFISVSDVPNIDAIIKKALQYKSNPLMDVKLGKGKRLVMVFLNPSMRTRLSTQIAASNLGMESTVFNVNNEGWAIEFEDSVMMNGDSVEHIKDVAPIFGQYFDVLAVRTFPLLKNKNEDYREHCLNQFIKYSGLPVISLESATLHPLQSFSDLITIQETIKPTKKPKVVLTWAPHIKPLPQCVANSFAQWMGAWGKADFVITCPIGYELDKKFSTNAQISHNQIEALKDADFVYAKNWSSYSQYGQMPSVDTQWMVTSEKMKVTNQARIMHCLPVRRNVEIGDDVLDNPTSLITQQAGNRVWAAQTILADILNKNFQP